MSAFTVASLKPHGRQSTIRGRKVHTLFVNKHCHVRYTMSRGDKLMVTVSFPCGYLTSWESIAAHPTLENAKYAAEAGERSRVANGRAA